MNIIRKQKFITIFIIVNLTNILAIIKEEDIFLKFSITILTKQLNYYRINQQGKLKFLEIKTAKALINKLCQNSFCVNMSDYNQLSNLKLIVGVINMGIPYSSKRKPISQVCFQNQHSSEENDKCRHISQINETKQKILICNGISYFLRRLDEFNKQDQPHETKQLVSFFEKQQQWLEWKLECDIAFIIDLTRKNDKKRIRLLKELLADKERHQSRLGIIYLGNRKAQFDLIDDSEETSYNLQKQLQNLKLDDWINIFKALRAHIIFNKEQILPSIYILSENQQSQNDESILKVVDNLLEDTCQNHSFNFHCNSYKVEDKDFYSEQELRLQ